MQIIEDEDSEELLWSYPSQENLWHDYLSILPTVALSVFQSSFLRLSEDHKTAFPAEFSEKCQEKLKWGP